VIPEKMVNEGIEATTNKIYFLGSNAILFQSKSMPSRCIKYDEYAEHAEYSTYVLTLQPNSSSTSASVWGMYFGKTPCSKVEIPQWIMKEY
jgi:hypothetical protein